MKRQSVLLVMGCTLLAICGSALAGPSKDLAKETVEEFNLEMRAVRADHPLLPVNYFEHADDFYGYALPRRFVRLAREGDTFRIRKFKTKDTYVRLELETARKTKLKMHVFDNGKLSQVFLDEVFPAVLRELFVFGTPPHRDPFAGRLESKLVHHGSCNHLPPKGEREVFDTLQAAIDGGYSPCGVCFTDEIILPIEGFATARAEAIEKARLFELAFPQIDDPDVQEEVQLLGESIVEDFPVETAGFDYSFKVVHSTVPQAYAFPTGFVYITDCLLNVVEDPAELRFVLAHEIAHCELMLPPVARSSPPIEVGGVYLDSESLARWYRQRELTADLLAVHHILALDGGIEALSAARSILRKMQFGSGDLPSYELDKYQTRPSYASRLEFCDPDHFQPVNCGLVFCGLDKHGEALVSMRILGIGRDEVFTRVYVLVECSDVANKSKDIAATRDVDHQAGWLEDTAGKTWILCNRDATFSISPGSTVLASLKLGSERDFEKVDLSAPREIELLYIPDVKDWVQLAAEDVY